MRLARGTGVRIPPPPLMKTVLITGASSGFGKETARLLAKKGYRLILVARRKPILEELANKLKTEVVVGTVDVRDKEQIERFIKGLPKRFKKIDVLINNAGLALGLSPAYESELEDWENMIDTNIKGVIYFTRFVLPIMKRQGSGHIVNIGSVSSRIPYLGANVYGATKAFIKQFSRNLRIDLLGTNIRITNIQPGPAETEFSIIRFKGDKNKANAVYQGWRTLEAKDIAEAIYWVITRPERINIDTIEIISTDQAQGGLITHKL